MWWVWSSSLAMSVKTMCNVWFRLLKIFHAVLCYGEVVNMTCSFHAYEFVNKLILDAMCILDCCKMKMFRICNWVCVKVGLVKRVYKRMKVVCFFENESTVFVDHNLFYMIVLNNIHHNPFQFYFDKCLSFCSRRENFNAVKAMPVRGVFFLLSRVRGVFVWEGNRSKFGPYNHTCMVRIKSYLVVKKVTSLCSNLNHSWFNLMVKIHSYNPLIIKLSHLIYETKVFEKKIHFAAGWAMHCYL